MRPRPSTGAPVLGSLKKDEEVGYVCYFTFRIRLVLTAVCPPEGASYLRGRIGLDYGGRPKQQKRDEEV